MTDDHLFHSELPTHTADGDEIWWSLNPDPDPDAVPVDITGWPDCPPVTDEVPRMFRAVRGVIITDSPIPPFPRTYEPRP
jgi:hypothetical protein